MFEILKVELVVIVARDVVGTLEWSSRGDDEYVCPAIVTYYSFPHIMHLILSLAVPSPSAIDIPCTLRNTYRE